MARSIYGRPGGPARREPPRVGLLDRLSGWWSAAERHWVLVIVALMLIMAAAIQVGRWIDGR